MCAAKAKSLVVVESPAKAKTISRFLGNGYQVEASYGHVRDLPQNAKEIPAAVRGEEWARLGVNVGGGFEPIYVVPDDKKQHVKRLKDALAQAHSLLLATDEDREGESISWHVLQVLKPKRDLEVQRIVFHEVTPEAIQQALQNPRKVNEDLVRAQEARRVLDRLYGYELSPLLWKRVAPGLSAGRVQSVAVRLLVERERQRMVFVGASFWDLRAELTTPDGRFRVRLNRIDGRKLADARSFDPATGLLENTKHLQLDAERALTLAEAAGSARPWKIAALDRHPGIQRPAPPFTTSTLQQESNRKLRFTSRRAMQVAQQLYEGVDLGGERVGLITYMRTDSMSLSQRAIEQARAVIGDAYGSDYLPERPIHYKTTSKGAQEAHEAIRPTDLARRPQDVRQFLDDDQYRLYELVWKRTLACQMMPAKFERTTVEVAVSVEGEELTFGAGGRRIVFPGFLRAYVEGSDDPEAQLGDQETLLPALSLGQSIEPLSVEAEGHETKPPLRYTEASLVKKLEEEGIGRPSTYASIISTIQDRGYVFKKGNELVPTFTAVCVTDLLEGQFADLVDTGFTAQMEDALDEIAAGKRDWEEILRTFYHGCDGAPGLRRRLEENEVTYPALLLGKDPESGAEVLVKIGRYGPYVRRGEGGKENIASIPDGMAPDELGLANALRLLESKQEDKKPLTHDSATGRAITLERGRFGEYLELALTEEERESKAKPKRVSLPKGVTAENLTPEVAQQLMMLPRRLGSHPETNHVLSTGIGRFGPFLKHGDEFRSLKSWQDACTMTLEQALEILAQPKPVRKSRFGAAKTVIKDLGMLEGAAGPVQVLEGRYGPYVTDGKTNASLPKGVTPDSLSAADALELLAKKRGAPKKKRSRRS
ncbi:MAG: type I DNA topoisomerase [Thermoanaerobaculia bacterium]|nr:type I DNA topoisomerase [Thermoanaerobaculia bacterium]